MASILKPERKLNMNIVLLPCPKVGKREYDVAILKQIKDFIWHTDIDSARLL